VNNRRKLFVNITLTEMMFAVETYIRNPIKDVVTNIEVGFPLFQFLKNQP
jgi:hypothetical protein